MKYKTLWWMVLTAAVLAAALVLTPVPILTGTDTSSSPILIIDAGHGGEDGGAVASDGTLESDVNLDIALRLEALASFWGVQTVMTRAGGNIEYPDPDASLSAKKKADQNARLALIHDTSGGILLSIHQNKYPAAAPWGIQVFYGEEEGSAELASLLQENLTGQLCPENRRVAEPINEEIYLMRKAACPAVLVECGFLSNPSELEKLKTETYRMELASVMLASYMTYIRGLFI